MRVIHNSIILFTLLFQVINTLAQSATESQEKEIQIFSDTHTTVKAVYKDRSDNIWIAGNFELVKIAGMEVTRFNEGLPDLIKTITEDASGNIWVSSDKEIASYDGKTWTMIKSPVNETINALAGDLRGNIWLITSETLSKFDGKKWSKIKIEKSGKYDFRLFNTMAFDSNGNLWIAPSILNEIYKYDGNKLTEVACNFDESSQKFTKFLYITPTNQIFIGTATNNKPAADGLYRFNGKSWKSYLKYEKVYSMFRTDYADYFVTTNKGVYLNFSRVSESHNDDIAIPGKNSIWLVGIHSNKMTTSFR
ncbi:MAG TPA: hypothetical protein VHO50_07350 [Bacteroidales bacterium]|nr:hypothetical protein [Bacteroidales bacterium]